MPYASSSQLTGVRSAPLTLSAVRHIPFILALGLGSVVLTAQPFTLDNASGLNLAGNKDGGLSWADFNGDGCLDLAVNTQTDTNCGVNACGSRIFLQDTTGTTCDSTWQDVTACLAPTLSNSRGSGTPNERSAVWGDLDGDGLLDLILNTFGNSTGTNSQAVEIYLNNGSGTTTNGTNSNSGCGLGVSWTQFGGDGIAPANSGGAGYGAPSITIDGRPFGTVSAVAPLGALQHVRIFGAGNEPLNAELVAIIDYDDDGDLDVFVDNHDDGIVVLQNTGTWGPGSNSLCDNDGINGDTMAGTPFVCDEATGLPVDDASNPTGDYGAVVDVDRDGDVDAILRKEGTNLDFFLNDGSGGFSGTDLDTATNGNKGGNAPCDFDSDGDFDFFWSEDGTNQIWEQTGTPANITADGSGTFSATNEPVASTGVSFAAAVIDGVACADWDNDGDEDLLLSSDDGDFLFRNNFVENGGILAPPVDRLDFTCLMGPSASCTDNTTAGCSSVLGDDDIGCANGEAVAFGDTNRDGDMDLIVNQDGNNEFWVNSTNDDHYLMVEALWDLDGVPGGTTRAAIGATVGLFDCEGNLVAPIQEVNGGRGHGSQNPAIVHFGLEDALGPMGVNPETTDYVVLVEYNAVHSGPDNSLILQAVVIPSDIPGYQLLTVTSTDANTTRCSTPSLIVGMSQETLAEGLQVSWETAAEADTLSLQLFAEKNGTALSAPFATGNAPSGSRYSTILRTDHASGAYWLKEQTVTGETKWHGPLSPASTTAGTRISDRLPSSTPVASFRQLAAINSPIATVSDRQRVQVTTTGIQALSLANLAQLRGQPESQVTQQLEQGTTRLRRGNQTVPVKVDNGLVYFYGEGAEDPLHPWNVYWFEPGPGLSMSTDSRVTTEIFSDGFETGDDSRWGIAPTLPAPSVVTHTEIFKEDALLFPGLLSNPDDDIFFWTFLFTPSDSTTNVTLTPDHVQVGAGAIELLFKAGEIHGTQTQSHKISVSLNGTQLGFAQWSGYAPHNQSWTVPSGLLASGSNDLELTLVDLGQGTEFVLVEQATLSYQRALVAQGGRAHLDANTSDTHHFLGFSETQLVALNITEPAAPVWLPVTGQGSLGNYALSLDSTVGEQLLVSQASSLLFPTVENAAQPIDVEAVATSNDHLVIYGDGLEEGARALASYRSGQGLSSVAIAAQAVYDTYSNGNIDPRAIREFLQKTEPQAKGRYVVLVGKGHHDYRNVQGHGGNLLPPMLANTSSGLIASDRMFLAKPKGGNTAIGRLPVRTAEELENYIADLVAYEESIDFDIPSVLAVNDERSAEGDFRTLQDLLLVDSPLPWDSIDAESQGSAQARLDFLAALNTANHDLVSYAGHGGFDRFAGSGLLVGTDLDGLSNNNPIVLALTCNAARFDAAAFDSLGELWVSQPGGGVAFLSSVALSDNSLSSSFGSTIYSAIFSPQHRRLGTALIEAWKQVHGGEMELVYQLHGDPALLLRP